MPADAPHTDDAPYINPGIYSVLGHVESILPPESEIIDLLPRIFLLTPQEIVNMIASMPEYDPSVIHAAISGMEFRQIAITLTSLIDRNYPTLTERLNTDENAFKFYSDVITLLYNRIEQDVLNHVG